MKDIINNNTGEIFKFLDKHYCLKNADWIKYPKLIIVCLVSMK
jgi:hypothetical protein